MKGRNGATNGNVFGVNGYVFSRFTPDFVRFVHCVTAFHVRTTILEVFMKTLYSLLFLLLCTSFTFGNEADFQSQIEADWLAEEARLGRDPGDWGVIDSLFERAEKTVASWHTEPEGLESLLTGLVGLKQEAKKLRQSEGESTDEARLDLYLKIRRALRQIVLLHPALKDRPIAFMKQRRVIQQMFHEYSGYYYDFFGTSGGGVFILPNPGRTNETIELTGSLPRGTFSTPSLSFDGKTIYFAWCRVIDGDRPWGEGRFDASKLPQRPEDAQGFEFNYFSTTRPSFHLFAVGVDGKNLRQITYGIHDDVDPCELPDGRIAFMSTRRGGYIRCNSHYEPLETSTMYTVRKDGTQLTQLSYHETDEWHPSVRPDGRLLYTRWDYVDRDATLFHGIWTSNPDGTAPMHLFGSYTTRIDAHYQPKMIPGTKKIVAVAGAHHAVVGGGLILIDTEKLARDPEDGTDSMATVENLTPEIPYSEVGGQWAKSFYSCPLPLSEAHFLVAFSFDPLPGMGPNYREDSRSGIYYFDRFGNKELLYRAPEISSVAPLLLNTPEGEPFVKKPPVVPSVLDEKLAEEMQGEFFLSDVNISQLPMPEGRKIVALRVFELLPKTECAGGNTPRIGFANTIPARSYLGEVPVEADGSAFFRVPARKPLYFQAIDEEGKAVQGMRSNVYLQPGEKRACVGCHEPVNQAIPQKNVPLAGTREPSVPTPDVTEPGPFGYARQIQPILDRNCVKCHDSKLDLRGTDAGEFTTSYESLKPFLRWYEWGGKSISLITSRPGECGTDQSPLTKILADENHKDLKLTDGERRVLYLWMDSNSPFYGSYNPREREMQKEGKEAR